MHRSPSALRQLHQSCKQALLLLAFGLASSISLVAAAPTGLSSSGRPASSLPVQPIRNFNPMCIGLIGGVGPQAGADVLNKMIAAGERKNWYYQARDMPMMTLNSSPRLDGETQNNWAYATEDEVKANVGQVLDDLYKEFPSCVREYGVVGLACNTIHAYLYQQLESLPGFVSIVGAVDAAFKRTAAAGSKVFVLGSQVTMTEEGEYGKLWKDGWQVNVGIPKDERGWLWDNVILKVQQNKQQLAHSNLKEYLNKWVKDKSVPVALSCTELPIAAKGPDGKFFPGYTFIDPNDELAKALIKRSEDTLALKRAEKYAGWQSGVRTFEKRCCAVTNNEGERDCQKCCEGRSC